jgi:acyl dehydratase
LRRKELSQIVPKDKLSDYIGRRLQADEWTKVTQQRIDQFADATDDHQFIHVDPERASHSPFGGTVAHGFLTLSLLPKLLEPIQIIPEDIVMGVNYGQNRVRYPHPVPCDSEIRAATTLLEVRDMAADRILMRSEVVVEIRGVDKPALVVESLAMFVLGKGSQAESAEAAQ